MCYLCYYSRMKKLVFMLVLISFVFVAIAQIVIAQNNSVDKRVMVYLYADGCMSCLQFDQIYNNLANRFNNNYKFLKVNIASVNGVEFARQFGVKAVPYVALIDNNENNYMHVSEQCIFDYNCIESNMESFGN